MSAVAFDTLKFVKILMAHGFATQQAEGLAAAVGDVQSSANVVTKYDLDAIRFEIQGTHKDLKNDINEVKRDVEKSRTEFKSEITSLRAEFKSEITSLRHEITSLESRLFIKLSGVIVASLSATLALIKFYAG